MLFAMLYLGLDGLLRCTKCGELCRFRNARVGCEQSWVSPLHGLALRGRSMWRSSEISGTSCSIKHAVVI